MQLYAEPNKILPVITPVLFPDPVWVLPNRPDGDLLTGTVPMKAERIEIPVPEIRNVSLGNSLAGIEDGVMAEDMAPIPISLSQEATSNINDNYLICPTLSKTVVAKLDKRTVTRTVKPKVVDSSVLDLHKVQMTSSLNPQSASCLVVNHAHSVCSHMQPQKKGVSPCIQKIEIKDVKGVSCASQCFFAPDVPSVVPSLAVGGRLQKFWQVWLILGANPRVVSILREGYTLPFKIRPPLARSPVIKNSYAHPGKTRSYSKH